MHSPLRTLLLGAGRMGRFHARVLAQSVPHINVVAVADINRGAACNAAELIASFGDHASPLIYDDPGEAMDQVDAAACIVVTSTPTHPELVETALQSGRHVFCEKPLLFDPAESMRLGAVARDSGLNLAVGFYRRFSPPFVAARAVIRSGELGRPVLIRASQWDATPPPKGFLRGAGGIAVDFGVHEFDSIEWLSDQRIVEIKATALPVVSADVKAIGEFDNLLIQAKLESGAVAMIDLSMNCGYADDVRAELLGEKGALFVETTPQSRLRVGTRDGLRTIELDEAREPLEAGITGELKAFAAVVNGYHSEALADAVASARATRLALAANHSALSGSVVTVLSQQTAQVPVLISRRLSASMVTSSHQASTACNRGRSQSRKPCAGSAPTVRAASGTTRSRSSTQARAHALIAVRLRSPMVFSNPAGSS